MTMRVLPVPAVGSVPCHFRPASEELQSTRTWEEEEAAPARTVFLPGRSCWTEESESLDSTALPVGHLAYLHGLSVAWIVPTPNHQGVDLGGIDAARSSGLALYRFGEARIGTSLAQVPAPDERLCNLLAAGQPLVLQSGVPYGADIRVPQVQFLPLLASPAHLTLRLHGLLGMNVTG